MKFLKLYKNTVNESNPINPFKLVILLPSIFNSFKFLSVFKHSNLVILLFDKSNCVILIMPFKPLNKYLYRYFINFITR